MVTDPKQNKTRTPSIAGKLGLLNAHTTRSVTISFTYVILDAIQRLF